MAATLGLAASLIAVLQLTGATLGASYNYASSVKNASRDKKRIIVQLRGLQKVLEDACELVVDEEAEATSRLPAMINLLNKTDGLPRCRSELETLKAMLEPKGGHSGLMRRLIWPLKEGDVRKTLDHLAQFQYSLGLAMNFDQTRLVLTMHEDMKVAKQSNEQDHHQKIYAWLTAPDHQAAHVTACKKRAETTGLWFIQGKRFAEWKCAPNSFLWLHGIPGAGKTILCSTIIEDISRHCQSGSSLGIAFFYFDFQNRDTRPLAVIRSLIKQLSSQCSTVPDALVKLFHENLEGQRTPTLKELLLTAKFVIQAFLDVYIVFDALDECLEREEFLALLGVIYDWRIGTLHLLTTSRKERDIEVALSHMVTQEIAMGEGLVNVDIRLHVSKVLEHAIEFQKFSAEEKDMIMITLLEGAQGMFRWVVCQLDALRKCRSPAALQRALKSLPKTLYQTYDRILAGIDEDDRQDAVNLLRWLAFSVRTISLDEAVEILATDPDAEGDELMFDPDRRLRDPYDVLTICSSLVTISALNIQVENGDGDGSKDEKIGQDVSHFPQRAGLKLAHFSVREYLTSDHLRVTDTNISFYHFNKKMADVFIAKICLAYLGCLDLTTIKNHPLADYAARNWIHHAQSDTGGSSDSLHRLIMELLDPSGAKYRNWLSIHNPDDDFRWGSEPTVIGNPLYFMSLAGLEHPSRALLEQGADVNEQGGWYGNALQAASSGGHEMMIRWLLEQGADVNSWGGRHGNALQAASYNGQSGIVRLLLDNGADVNAQGGWHGNALQAASSSGHNVVVRLLLEHGADVNVQGGEYGNALQAASFNRHETVVRLLLAHGADVNAKGGRYGAALQAASSGGHEVIIRLLLEQGAIVNAQGEFYGNALQAASFRGHEVIVQMLLEHGADVHAQRGRYGNALQAASLEGYDAIVGLLLEHGAYVNAQGGKYGNALQAASSGGHDAIVTLLLESGANVNAQGGKYGTPLHAASSEGHDTIVRLLLEYGANVNAQGEENGTPLQAASSEGHVGIIRLLLERGADINAKGGLYGNALLAALFNGHEMTVRLLLEHGADPNAHEGDYGNVLQAASAGGYDAIVRLLLEHGGDANQGDEYENALQAASAEGRNGIVRLLLEHGADINAQGVYGTALQEAMFNGHEVTVQLLLEHGAEMKAQFIGSRYKQNV